MMVEQKKLRRPQHACERDRKTILICIFILVGFFTSSPTASLKFLCICDLISFKGAYLLVFCFCIHSR